MPSSLLRGGSFRKVPGQANPARLDVSFGEHIIWVPILLQECVWPAKHTLRK